MLIVIAPDAAAMANSPSECPQIIFGIIPLEIHNFIKATSMAKVANSEYNGIALNSLSSLGVLGYMTSKRDGDKPAI